jgi:hypothetical protein
MWMNIMKYDWVAEAPIVQFYLNKFRNRQSQFIMTEMKIAVPQLIFLI